MSKEARTAFLKMAISVDARWAGNFRDLNAAVIRMTTLAQSGRINVADVEDERQRPESNSRTQNKSDFNLETILTSETIASNN